MVIVAGERIVPSTRVNRALLVVSGTLPYLPIPSRPVAIRVGPRTASPAPSEFCFAPPHGLNHRSGPRVDPGTPARRAGALFRISWSHR
jgi:hypothetical protein